MSQADFSNTALLIAAHGSPHSAGGTSTTRRLAQHLANMEIFTEVGAGFLAEKPYVSDVLNDLNTENIYIVPNLASTGYIFEEKLPKALGLTGIVTERITPKGHQRLILTEPVGTHPFLIDIMTTMVQNVVSDLSLDMNDTALVIVGHGSTKSRASFLQTLHVAKEMAAFGLPDMAGHKAIFTAFLDEQPFIQDWKAQIKAKTKSKTVLFLPFLISDGYHATRDVPLAIGFDAGDQEFQANLRQETINQIHLDGQDLIYLPPMGSSSDITEIIFSRVKQAQKRFSPPNKA